jgi:hypothetical protein
MSKTDYKLPQESERKSNITTGDAQIDDDNLHVNRNRHEVQPKVNRSGLRSNNYVIENRHNASIVLGRDYEYDKLNDTSIGMIDITTGRVADSSKTGFRRTLTQEVSSGDMIADAAKVYVSQKTDIDALYGFTSRGDPSNDRSAVGIKADAVRLVSRDPGAGIRLIVQPDSTGPTTGKNSQGGQVAGVEGGVQLVGPGKENLQALVKSDDLAKSIGKLVDYIEKLEVMVWDFVSYQKKFNSAVSQATDIEAFYAQKGIPDPLLIKSNAKTSLDLFSYVENSGRSIRKDLSDYKVTDLGLTKSGENTEKTGEPVFSSKYHKLN